MQRKVVEKWRDKQVSGYIVKPANSIKESVDSANLSSKSISHYQK